MANDYKVKKNSAENIALRKPVRRRLEKAHLIEEVEAVQPAVVRIFHWGFAFSLTGIILTGLEIHYPFPFLAINFGKLFVFHITFAWLSMGFMSLRLADILLRKDTSLLPTLKDLKALPRLLAYFLYLRETPPPKNKYDSGQKVILSSWFILFIFLAFISLSSYWMDEHLDFIPRLLGGFQIVRWLKFIGLIYFSATIPLHIYLNLTENASRMQAMITGLEQKKHPKS